MLRMAAARSCGQGDGHFANARGLTGGDRLAAGRTVFEHEANGVLSHRKRLALVAAVGDDFRNGGNPNGKAALLFGLKHDGEGVRMIQFEAAFCGEASS
jgi:hypothetical protein